MYITNEMRNTYGLSKAYDIIVDHAHFVQNEWNMWSVVFIEHEPFYLVK